MPLACLDIVQALQAPYETTVSKLLDEYGLDDTNLLEAYAKLDEILSAWNVKFQPPLGVGGPGDVRVLQSTKYADFQELVAREMAEGEGQRLEFKQTLGMDVKKKELGGKPAVECFSEDIVLSSLKTVAGFLNSGGGTLLIGVKDDGSEFSIENEFVCTCPKGNLSLDGWELRFRGFIEKYFIDGASVQSYVQVSFADVKGSKVARILVGGRNKISFIRGAGGDTLYLRIGNRTQNIPFHDIEQYFDMSRRA